MFLKMLLISLPAIFVLVLTPARASTVEYNLTVDQCTGSCGPSGTIFGTITLTDTVANVGPNIFANDLPSAMANRDDENGLSWSPRDAWFPHEDGLLNFLTGLSTSSFEGVSSNHFFAVDIYNAATCAPEGGKIGVVEAIGSQFGIADAPEPGSITLFGCGLVTFAWMLWKRSKRTTLRVNS